MFEIVFSDHFKKTFRKVIEKDQVLKASLQKALDILTQNPFYSSLQSHKVDTKRNKNVWSSRVNGDWRIVWVFDDETKKTVILCLEVGTHSGSNQIYPKKSS